MYKAFEISISPDALPFKHGNPVSDVMDLYQRGKVRFDANKQYIESNLSSYIRPDGRIDGELMVKDWFPIVNSHVFLSHSHADEALAITFSQWLFENFRIRTFIDSTVWGYADSLLKEIDDTYSKTEDGELYSYSLRNRTTAFVHNLLSASLSNMIDKCECLMFLNTPNSIIPKPDKEETSSPWIFYELQQSAVVRSCIARTRFFSEGGVIAEAKDFKVALPAQTNHLIRLNGENLYKWRVAARNYKDFFHPEASLDLLYHLVK